MFECIWVIFIPILPYLLKTSFKCCFYNLGGTRAIFISPYLYAFTATVLYNGAPLICSCAQICIAIEIVPSTRKRKALRKKTKNASWKNRGIRNSMVPDDPDLKRMLESTKIAKVGSGEEDTFKFRLKMGSGDKTLSGGKESATDLRPRTLSGVMLSPTISEKPSRVLSSPTVSEKPSRVMSSPTVSEKRRDCLAQAKTWVHIFESIVYIICMHV